MKPTTLDPKNESHWTTHAKHEAKRDFSTMTAPGAPKPDPMSPLWNDWAANNPQPTAIAMARLDPTHSLMMSLKGLTQGAKPCE